jgi:hypothetical protein
MAPHQDFPTRSFMFGRIASRLIGLACGLVLAAAPAVVSAQSNVELAAELGGRVIGAARACGINPDRIRRASDRLISLIGASSGTATEREAAKGHFTGAQSAGAEEVRSEKSKCQGIHVSFSEIEVKLGRAPALDNDPVVSKRGVPAIGALRPDPATATRRQ